MSTPESLDEPRSGFITSVGLRLHHLSHGPDSGPLVVLHHGFLDHARAWDRVAGGLAASGYRVVVPDARGHGDSDWVGPGGSYYFPDYLLDLHHLLATLGTGPVALIGHSMGGAVVMYWAATFPDRVRCVVAMDGMGPPDVPPSSAPGHLRDFVASTSNAFARRTAVSSRPMRTLEDAAARLRQVDALIPEAEALRLAGHATRVGPDGTLAWKYDPLHRARAGVAFSLPVARALWGAIRSPVLHLRAGKNPFILPDHSERLAAVRDVREVTLPHVGHNMHAHDPDAVVATIRSFLGVHLPAED